MFSKKRIIVTLLVFTLLLGLPFSTYEKVFALSSQKQIKVNNTILSYNAIVYVDGTSGDDSMGDGSKGKPFKTVVKGFDFLNDNCKEGGAIVIKDGTYDVSGLFKGDGYNLSKAYNGMKVSLLADTMGKVQFNNFSKWMIAYNDSTYRVKVCLYGIILNNIADGKDGVYHLGGDDWTNEFYNCVFVPDNYGGWNKRVTNSTIKVANSLFIGKMNANTTDCALKGDAVNCASVSANLDPYNGTKTNCLYNIKYDSATYNITSSGWEHTGIGTNPDGSMANIGVYGGQFAWGSKVIEIIPDSTTTGNRAILEIVMTNGTIKEYDLTADEIKDYLTWYDDRSDGTGKSYYKIIKRSNVKPFNSRNEYLSFDKIYSFEVKDYNDK
jgi:hypothetical protein